MQPTSRRQLLFGALAVPPMAATALRFRPARRPVRSNGDLSVGVVGLRGRGEALMHAFHEGGGARVVALCDVDENVLRQRAQYFAGRNEPVATYRDVRELLGRKEVDAVAVATPNHWHSLITVWACQAGKDVYVEKPVSHNVWEGRQAANAAARYGRIVQTGTMSRSAQGIREAIEFLRAGGLGKITVARGLCYKTRTSIGKVRGAQPVPAGIDYDLWCGPADLEPLRRANLHYDWHWVWATGNGDIGNQGIHQMDIARWALGARSLSRRVLSVGGRFGYVDDGQTPNSQFVLHEFDEGLLVFEVRGLYQDNGNEQKEGYKGIKIGNVIECEHGYVALDTGGGRACDADGKEIRRFEPGPDSLASHVRNFLDAVASRRAQDLRSDIVEGHLSSALCHIGNISHRVGQLSDPGELREQLAARPAAAEACARLQQHLGERGVDLAASPPVLGAALELDPVRERFTGAGEANANMLLARNYREPFVVPEALG